MAYDEDLEARVRDAVAGEPGLSEQRMFGGLAFLVHRNMAVAASGQGGLLLRVDPADSDALTREPHMQRFEMRGRAMDGWLHVGVDAVATEPDLQRWVDVGLAYARSLPPK